MNPYFADAGKVDALCIALERRRGTPFRKNMAKPGHGYDCWHLIIDVLEESGLEVAWLRTIKTESLNWGKFHPRSKILEFLRSDPVCRKHVRRMDEADPVMAGDLIAVREGFSSHHLAIAASPLLAWQIARGGRVGPVSISLLRTGGYFQFHYRIHV